MTPSIVLKSYFKNFSFPDPLDGRFFAIELSDPRTSPVSFMFDRLYKAKVSPFWTSSHEIVESENIQVLRGKDFSFRVLKFDDTGVFLNPVSTSSEMGNFWQQIGYEFVQSEFLHPAKLAAKTASELLITIEEPLSFIFNAQKFSPEKKVPNYLLELVTGPNIKAPCVALDRLLHKSYQQEWFRQLPGNQKSFKAIVEIIETRQEALCSAIADTEEALMTVDPHQKQYILLKKIAHKIEAFLLYGKRAYGLTNFSNFSLKEASASGGYERLKAAYMPAPVLFPIFKPKFEVHSAEGKLIAAYKIDSYQIFQQQIEAIAAISSMLPLPFLDTTAQLFFKMVAMFHAANTQLDYFSLDQLYIKSIEGSICRRKVFLREAQEKKDCSYDFYCLGLVAYNLWIEYREHKKTTFTKPEQLNEKQVLKILETTFEVIETKEDALEKEKLQMIIQLFQKTATVAELSGKLEVIIHSLYHKK